MRIDHQNDYIRLKNEDNSEIAFELPPDVEDEGQIVKIVAYQEHKIKQAFYVIFSILTCGFFYLLCRWDLQLKIKATMSLSSINQANNLLIFCKDGTFELVPLNTEKLAKSSFMTSEIDKHKTFQYRLFKYAFDEKAHKMKPIFFQLTELTNNKIHELHGQGIRDEASYKGQSFLYGINSTEVPEKPLLVILIDEILSPFTIFQVFSCSLWFGDQYEIYAGIIVFVTVVSVLMTLKEAKDNMKNLREMSYFETKVNVYRGLAARLQPDTNPSIASQLAESLEQKKTTVSSFALVPGDVVEVPENEIMPCDIILLNGSCIMNESMLTGESIPIVKTALPYNNLIFNPTDENKASVLYSGTKCIETRYYMKGKIPVLGLVYQTGFNTQKGQLVRSILFPKTTNFNFYKDALKFICSIALISVVGLTYTIVTFVLEDAEPKDIVLKCLDMITVTIPPALPTCMSIGIGFALTRLKKKNIFCISPPKINISGKINIMCFDKTGTLTEEGLDTFGIRPVRFDTGKDRVKFSPIQKKPHPISDDLEMFNRSPKELPSVLRESQKSRSQLLLEVLACCHSLTLVNNQLIGDPLDIKMFEWTGWVMEDNNENKFDELILAVVKPKQDEQLDYDQLRMSLIKNTLPDQIGIIRRFDFSSKLQRMSVIVRNLNEDKFRVYVKGSPEKMREICKPETIPKEFHKILDFYSRNGYRVLGCGSRTLKISFRNIDKIERNEVEQGLTFLGFLIMENKLKPITAKIINDLQSANIRTIMVTGDNVLTAISVARQCSLVNPKQRVYFGDLTEGKKPCLVWKDFDFADHSLNPDTLVPEKAYELEEPLDDLLESEIEEEKKEDEIDELTRKFQEQTEDKNLENPVVKREGIMGQGKQSKSLIFSINQKTAKQAENALFYRSFDQKRNYDLERTYLPRKIEKLPTEQDLQIIEDQNPPWLTMENNSYVLAVSGKAFSYMLEENSKGASERIFKLMLENAQIFARMKPNEKTVLIQSLQKYMYHGVVGMCGDGANDCGALKAADVGVSLSEAEASIAAPFTSKTQNISCVPELLKEGRCALTTSFQCFKYMALYSMIQFGGVTVLHGALSNFSNFEYLYVDMVVIFPLAIFMGYTEPYPLLSKYMPSSNLISFPVLSSVIGQIVIQIGFQVGLYVYTVQKLSSNQTCVNLHGHTDDMDQYWNCYENAVGFINIPLIFFMKKNVFLMANFQYLATVFAFSIGPPFRKHFYTNYYFTATFVVLLACCLLLVFVPPSDLRSFLSLYDLDSEWKLTVFIAVIINFVVTYFYEKVVVPNLSLLWKSHKEKKRILIERQENNLSLAKQTSLSKA